MDRDYARNEESEGSKGRNTNYCCVPQCNQYAGGGISMHHFPKNPDERKKWEAALKMGKPASNSMTVCSRHFIESDFFPGAKIRRKVKQNVVPSQNLPQRQHDRVPSEEKVAGDEARTRRAQARRDKKSAEGTSSTATVEVMQLEVNDDNEDDGREDPGGNCLMDALDIGVQANLVDCREVRPSDNSRGLADVFADLQACEKTTQVNFLPIWKHPVSTSSFLSLSLPDLLTSNESLFTFTGIHSKDLLEALAECVGDLSSEAATNKKVLPLKDRIVLTMVKVKQNMSFSAISVLFGISRQTCSNYFKSTCPMLARVLKSVIPWPDQELIRCNLPKSFNHYRDTRIILDCAESEIEKCKCLRCRILTYSQYKKKNTVKFNLGCTPSGLITEVSVPYGGRASDKRIVNESRILDKLDFQDGVMVDKGYRIEKECDERCLHLIRPPFLKKQKQLSRADALKNADIARARVHVERVIQRLRQYELLCGPIPWTLAPYFEDVLTICCGLTNLGPPVMNIDKFM